MWIKICGIRDRATAEGVARIAPDAIGLNFSSRSPRHVTPESAAEIVRGLPPSIEPVGVFVNHTRPEVIDLCRLCRLATIQLHGDESPEFVASLPQFRIIRAYRIGEEGLDGVAADLERCAALGVRPAACLIDARVPGAYGGTGQAAPWDLLADGWRKDRWPPLVLAGGLTPENVAAAIAGTHPWGVDVASGVESTPGEKDLARVARFVQAARAAS
jgi:phosphoribosylanthranilate isomerase